VFSACENIVHDYALYKFTFIIIIIITVRVVQSVVIVGAARRQAETFLEADQTDAAVVVGAGHVSAARCRVRITLVGLPTTLLRRLHTRTPRRGAAVSGVRRTNEVNARRARLVLGRVTVFRRVYTISVTVCNKPTGSTQPCIPPGSLN